MEAFPSSSTSPRALAGIGLFRQAVVSPSHVASGFGGGGGGGGSSGLYRKVAIRFLGATNFGEPKITSVYDAGAFFGLNKLAPISGKAAHCYSISPMS